ncbi:2-oxoisovalerate dehydrogenase [bacterium]|nr:2-oxoisovalerate dehydrogenase [bacterium]
MKELIFFVEESPEGGYCAKALGCSIYAEAEELGELKEAIRDATRCHFETYNMPHIIRLHLVKDEVIAA